MVEDVQNLNRYLHSSDSPGRLVRNVSRGYRTDDPAVIRNNMALHGNIFNSYSRGDDPQGSAATKPLCAITLHSTHDFFSFMFFLFCTYLLIIFQRLCILHLTVVSPGSATRSIRCIIHFPYPTTEKRKKRKKSCIYVYV